MANLNEQQLAMLAREIVMNVRNYKAVFVDYGIDENDYYEIDKNDYYRRVKEHFTIEWNSALSTKDRLQIGSLAYIEQLLPVLTRRAMREKDPEPLTAANDVLKSLQKIAGVGEAKQEKSLSERFVITINLGGETEVYDKSIAINANDSMPTATICEAINGEVDLQSTPQPSNQ